LNCLIGPGDAGKSSVLNAIDLCLGARRNLSFSDADFHGLDVTEPISVSITIGELDDGLKSRETYGHYRKPLLSSSKSLVGIAPHFRSSERSMRAG
jgi:putative ATP-dependent endonuclease of OLD family